MTAARICLRTALLGALFVVVGAGVADAQPEPVAVIEQGGGDGVVDRAEAERWVRLQLDPVRAKRQWRTLPRPGTPAYREQRVSAIAPLIEAEWALGEARDHGIVVTDAELEPELTAMRRDGFITDGEMARSGVTVDDLRGVIRGRALMARLEERLVPEPPAVSDADVRRYVRDHPEVLWTDELRTAAVVTTSSRRRALNARSALDAGRSWGAIVRRYGQIDAGLGGGGVMTFESSGGDDELLHREIFRARRGRIVGPRRADLGWAVFEVRRITPSRRLAYRDVAPGLQRELTYWRGQEAIAAWRTAYRATWRPRTACVPEFSGYACGGRLPLPAPPA